MQYIATASLSVLFLFCIEGGDFAFLLLRFRVRSIGQFRGQISKMWFCVGKRETSEEKREDLV